MAEAILDPEVIEHSLVGYVATGGAPEQTLNLTFDATAAAASVAVAAGTILEISDIVASAAAAAIFKVQQSNDAGGSWFDIAIVRLAAAGTVPYPMNTPLRVVGGTAVLLRARAETPGGAAQVGLTLRAAQMAVA